MHDSRAWKCNLMNAIAGDVSADLCFVGTRKHSSEAAVSVCQSGASTLLLVRPVAPAVGSRDRWSTPSSCS